MANKKVSDKMENDVFRMMLLLNLLHNRSGFICASECTCKPFYVDKCIDTLVYIRMMWNLRYVAILK